MDCEKIGALILRLRTEKGMTQKQLAALLLVGDKAVSKWERGQGCPDVSLLPELSRVFGVPVEQMLSGELPDSRLKGGSMRKLGFYVCPACGNIIAATGEASISCCGRTLHAQEAKKAEDAQKLCVESVDGGVYISGAHPMTKEHYIDFVAFATGDKLLLVKQYPEWDLSVRFERFGHGKLYWHCVRDGLFYQLV